MFRYFCVNVLASAGACRASTGPVLVGGAACPALEGMAKACGVAEAQGGSDVVDLEERGRQVVDSQGLAQARQQFQIGRPLFVEPSPQRPGVDAQPRRDLVDAGKAAGCSRQFSIHAAAHARAPLEECNAQPAPFFIRVCPCRVFALW